MAEDTALSRGNSPDYAAAILEFLGERDPLDVFVETPAKLREAVAGLSDAQLRAPERPGKWSVVAVVQHLADAELTLGFRYRKVLAQPGEPIPAIDQDAWAENLEYENVAIEDALGDFEALRRANLRVLRKVLPHQWDLVGLHEQRGEESLGHMVRLYAGHDCYHLRQIERIREAIGA